MVVCDLCGQRKECFQRDIGGKRHDICSDCMESVSEKAKGKGRGGRGSETQFGQRTGRVSNPARRH